LQTQSRSYVSRVGSSGIKNIALSAPSAAFYSVVLGDNSFKVLRTDNNKMQMQAKMPAFDKETLDRDELIKENHQNQLLIAADNEI